jgi:hypothetical protein
VALIAKIIGFPTIGAQPEEYLENKVWENEIAETVKAQFGANKGNKCIILKDINDPAMRFTNKLMDCTLLRKCRKEEALEGVIEIVV